MLVVSLIAVGLIGFIAAYVHYRDVFNPVGIFCAVWFIPLGVGQLHLSASQTPFDGLTWLVVLSSAAAFIFGCLSAPLFMSSPRYSRVNAPVGDAIDARRFRLFTTVLFVAAIGAYIYEARLAGSVPIFSARRTEAYTLFAQNYVHYLTVSTIAVALLVIAYVHRFGFRSWLWSVTLFFGSVFVLFSLLARLQLFVIIVGAVAMVNYARKRKLTVFTLVVLSGGLIVFMDAVAVIRAQEGLSYAIELGELRMPPWARFLAWPYLYLALNFEKLHWLIHAGFARTYGSLSFLPLFAFTFTRHLVASAQPIDFESQLGWFNTMTYLWFPYSDFGVAGTLCLPFVYGVASTAVYIGMLRRPHATSILLYGLVLFSVMFTFFYNFFAFPLMYVLAVEIWLTLRLSSVRGVRLAMPRARHVVGTAVEFPSLPHRSPTDR